MSSYFSMPSFARAKQNTEELEKTNPQNPVLKDDDEKFLEKQISSGATAEQAKDEPATKITESGEEKEVSKEEAEQVGEGKDQVAVPETQPETGDGAVDSTEADKTEESVEDPPEEVPDESTGKSKDTAAKAKKLKKNTGFDLPSQEEAEAATRGFNVGASDKSDKTQGDQADKRTWASYLPTLGATGKKDQSEGQQQTAEQPEGEKGQQRTWAQLASNAYSSLPAMPSISRGKDSKAEPVYNEDGTVNEEETKKKQEREVSVLLDKLDLSSINNRVFAFSGETQKIYERFSLILKDTMNGGPTAYEDMEKLMRDAGPQLEKQFQSMPPFVQTLVKSLPAKLGTTLGPELLAAASEKPGGDMKARMQAASKQSSTGDSSLKAPETSEPAEKDGQKKQKRKIPGLKGLMSGQGMVASILRNVVSFITTRFPFLASATNVVMSLSVFILMFVFWYCHKRGKEARLAKEAESAKDLEGGVEGKDGAEDEDDEIEVEVTDDEDPEEEAEAEKEGEVEEKVGEEVQGDSKPVAEQADSAETVGAETEKQAEPEQEEKSGKGAELEAEKATGA